MNPATLKRRPLAATLVVFLLLSLVLGALAMPVPAAGAAAVGDFSLLELCLSFIRTYYPGEYSVDQLMEGAAKGMFSALGDPYSDYLTRDEYQSLMTGLTGAFGGLGIYIDTAPDGYIVIIAPIKGTPADRAGLRPGDKIATVDGEDFRHTELSAAARRLRGEPGTRVTLGIIRAGVIGVIEVELTRAWIEINPVDYELLPDGIGYIHLSDFTDRATAKMDVAIASLKAKGATALVLDLRNNGGGLLAEALSIAERFLTSGQIILQIRRGAGDPDVYRASGTHYHGLPVAVIVNNGTASAAEILAAALAGNGMGTVVGVTTYGKGSIQNVWSLLGGAGIKLTTAQFLTPRGEVIQGVGIQPGIWVEDDSDAIMAPQLAYFRPIRHMRVGLDTLEVQHILRFLGYAGYSPDGVYGMRWVDAIRAFQKDHGLYTTGIVDEKTANALNQAARDHLAATAVDAQLQRAIEVLSKPQ